MGRRASLFFDSGGAGKDRTMGGGSAELLLNPGAIPVLRYFANLPLPQRKAIVRLMALLAGAVEAET